MEVNEIKCAKISEYIDTIKSRFEQLAVDGLTPQIFTQDDPTGLKLGTMIESTNSATWVTISLRYIRNDKDLFPDKYALFKASCSSKDGKEAFIKYLYKLCENKELV